MFDRDLKMFLTVNVLTHLIRYVEEMSVEEMSVGKVSNGEMPVEKRPVHPFKTQAKA